MSDIMISDGEDVGACLEALDRLEDVVVYREWSHIKLEAGRRYDNMGSIHILLSSLEEILRG